MPVTADTGWENRRFALFSALFIITAAAAVTITTWHLLLVPFAVLLFYAGWLQREPVFYFLLFTLPFSTEFQLTPQLGTDIPDEALMLLVSFLFLADWVYSPKLLPWTTIKHPLILILLVALAWIALTVVFSGNPLVSLKYLLAKGWYAGAFVLAPLILFREKKHLLAAVKTLAFSTALVTLIILYRHSQSGFRFASINDAVSPFFRNHVNYSAMLVCLLPLFFVFLGKTQKKKSRILLAILIFLLLAALFFSYARGAWLALLAGALAGWLIKRKKLLVFFVAAIITTVAALVWLRSGDRYLRYAHDYRTTVFHENFSTHLIATYKLKDVSTAERFYRWIAGVSMIKNNWLTGYGPNTFYENYKGYTVPAYKTWVSDNPDRSTVHNYYLLTAIEQGIPGLLILLVLLGVMFWYAQYLYHRVSDVFYKTVAFVSGIILTMLLLLNFLSDLVETDKIGSLFFLCLAVLVTTDIQTRKESSDPSPDIERVP